MSIEGLFVNQAVERTGLCFDYVTVSKLSGISKYRNAEMVVDGLEKW